MLPSQRHLFDIPHDITYLNCAYMSPLMKPVVEAGNIGMARKAHPWEIAAEKFFTGAEEFRTSAAKLFDSSADCVAIIPSASYGIATAAGNVVVGRGQKILVLDEQFPSHYYPWQRLAAERGAVLQAIPCPQNGDWTTSVLDALSPDVAVAAFPHVQWTSGLKLDLVRIGEACRKQGIALVLDLTQSLGALPFSVRDVQPDFAVAACYKWLLSPYTTGVMYVAPKWHNGKPLEENWIQRANSRDFTSLTLYSDDYDHGARRFDMGERSNFALLPAAQRAIEQLLEWGIAEISETIGSVNESIASRAAELGFSTFPASLCATHYLCLRRDGGIPKSLTETLAREKIFVSLRGSSIRVTPHLYNSQQDADRLISCLRSIV